MTWGPRAGNHIAGWSRKARKVCQCTLPKTELGKRLSVRGSLVSRRAELLFTGAAHGKPPGLFDEQHAAVSASFGRTPALMLDDSVVQDFGLHRSRFRGATRACEGQKSTAHNPV
ncbi:uncharacterized protein VDAG_03529 [Verticillium dahliae VdLs.17]|uniref:Uncharacterized protein n=1 Tax=Verticillium dahliae (strain VdLs.17 / ATCC MYA-4575 / FGSC 10137) TaxID=498257 RepID=G2WZT7_VERDV|nr:uncharacterized protein VDAG_03529 [Verticillium dahliae VdLs.17]EGY22089.1 hypothetical protein VDAG_03529 [Verticillium dahliae VdLs.17]